VILLEKNRRAGVKILMSGGTRCNITNARGLRWVESVSGPIDPAFDRSVCRGGRAIQAAFETGGDFLGPALRHFDVDQTVRMFEAEGVATKIEGNGKIFPVSNRAVDVLAALLRRLYRSGVDFRGQSPVRSIARNDIAGGFKIFLTDSQLTARRLIVAVGGNSYPGCGTTGDGYGIARAFGHTVIEPRPALVPIRVDADWVNGLRGLTLPDVVVTVRSAAGQLLQQRREAILFTHFGLSGPAILDVSRSVARHAGSEGLELRLDLLPARPREEIDSGLQTACRQGRAAVASLLAADLPHRLTECLMEAAGVPRGRLGPDLSRQERVRLVTVLKGLALPVRGTLGFEKAEVTSGGVALEKIDSRTLESRIVPGLHFAGEVLDLDGLIGGYNFQAAWSTGWLAGEMAAAGARVLPGRDVDKGFSGVLHGAS
jgi:predicted Rossmann fold flavoprotein